MNRVRPFHPEFNPTPIMAAYAWAYLEEHDGEWPCECVGHVHYCEFGI